MIPQMPSKLGNTDIANSLTSNATFKQARSLAPEGKEAWSLIPGSTALGEIAFFGEHAQSTGMQTALYTRVSSDDQNCEMQLRELRAYAQARGWEIVEEFKDEGWSGTRPLDRPAPRCNWGSAPLNIEYCLADRALQNAKARKNHAGSVFQAHQVLLSAARLTPASFVLIPSKSISILCGTSLSMTIENCKISSSNRSALESRAIA